MIGRPKDHSSSLARGELADREQLERQMALDEEGTLRRREFLARTAAVAGGGGARDNPARGAADRRGARRRTARRRLPSPKNMPLDTVVVLMMENRSFDHYFGWHPKADARNTASATRTPRATRSPPTTSRPDFQGCAFRDPDHGWDGGRWQWHRGRNDRFVTGNEAGTGSDEFAIGYYLKEDVPFIPHAADAYTLYDRWFCSIMASTYPEPALPVGGAERRPEVERVPDRRDGFTWETIFDRATANGVTVGYYAVGSPVRPAVRRPGTPLDPADRRRSTPTPLLGNLPNICFVDPPFLDGGGGNGLSADEHPHGDIRLGQAFMSDIVHAFIESPAVRARGAVHQLRRVGRLLRPRAAAVRARRPPQPAQHRRGLGPDRVPDPRRVRLAVHPRRAGQPHAGHPRVDPEADLLQVPPRPPQQAAPICHQHRPHLRLAQPGPEPARAARPGHDRRRPRARSSRASRRSARSRTT